MLVHALGEALGRLGAVVAPRRVLGGGGLSLDGRRGGLGGTATGEHASDGVADGGADGDTTVSFHTSLSVHYRFFATQGPGAGRMGRGRKVEKKKKKTYAAVLAI